MPAERTNVVSALDTNPLSSRASNRKLRIAQLENEQVLEDTEALKALCETEVKVLDVDEQQVGWWDLDGLKWPPGGFIQGEVGDANHLSATSSKSLLAPDQTLNRKSSLTDVTNSNSTSHTIASNHTKLFPIAKLSVLDMADADKDSTIRAPNSGSIVAGPRPRPSAISRNIFATSTTTQATASGALPLTPNSIITPPLLASKNDSLSHSYFPKQETVRILLQKHVANKIEKQNRRSPIKGVFSPPSPPPRNGSPSPLSKSHGAVNNDEGYTAGLALSRNPSSSYKSGTGAILVETDEDDDDGDSAGLNDTISFPATTIDFDAEMDATIRLPTAKRKCRPSAPSPSVFLNEARKVENIQFPSGGVALDRAVSTGGQQVRPRYSSFTPVYSTPMIATSSAPPALGLVAPPMTRSRAQSMASAIGVSRAGTRPRAHSKPPPTLDMLKVQRALSQQEEAGRVIQRKPTPGVGAVMGLYGAGKRKRDSEAK